MSNNTTSSRQSFQIMMSRRRRNYPFDAIIIISSLLRQLLWNGNNKHHHHHGDGGDDTCKEFDKVSTNTNNTRIVSHHGINHSWQTTSTGSKLLAVMRITIITIIMMMLSMTAVDGFSSISINSSGGLSTSPLVNVRSSSSYSTTVPSSLRKTVFLVRRESSRQATVVPSCYDTNEFIRGGGSMCRFTTALHLSNNNINNNNQDQEDSFSSDNNDDINEDSLKALQLIQQWLLLHLPSLSNDDLKLYSMQLFDDGFDSVERLEGVNNGGGGAASATTGLLGGARGSSSSGRLEDLYFMKKGHRRVLMQKIGKVREMKANAKNRLRLFEEEDGEVVMMMDGESGEEEGGQEQQQLMDGDEVEIRGQYYDDVDVDSSNSSSSEGDKYKPTIGSGNGSQSSSTTADNDVDIDDDDSLISLTAWEDKQLEEFVYNEQERDVMDDKSRRRLKQIDDYLKEHRNKEASEEGGGDEHDVTSFETKELEDFVYNEQTRGAMDDKGKRRLKEIEKYLREKWQRELEGGGGGGDDEAAVGSDDVDFDEYDSTSFEQKELVDFVYNAQTRDAMDDKSKRRLKDIEAYIKEQQQQQREEEEELNIGNNVREEEEEGGASLSSPSLPASWNFADLEDFIYNEQERDVMDDKGRRRLREIEEYVQAERTRLREDAGSGYDEEELLDDFASRYQGIATARDEKKTGGSVVSSSSVAKEEKRLEEFREAWLARQRGDAGVNGPPTNMSDEDLMDDFASRYQKLGTAGAVSEGSSEKSARRLKELDAFLRARQSRQSRGVREQSETPMDDFEARFQTIGNSAADAVADGSSDKSKKRLRALDAFIKSRQSRAAAAAKEEALRLELLQKPMKDLTATERKERIRVEEFQRLIAKEQQGNRPDTNDDNSSNAVAAAKRKSNEERRLEALNKWTAEQNELVEKRRLAKMLAEYERLKEGSGKKKVSKKVTKPKVTQDRPSPSSIPPPNEDAISDDFFEDSRVHSMSTTLRRSNKVSELKQKSQKSSKLDAEDCVGDECFDITRNSFSERDSKSLATTLKPSNQNAKMDSYVPGSKDKASDFLPPRSNNSNDADFLDEQGFDISNSAYSERDARSLSTTLPPSTKNAKQNSYVPGSTSDDEDCVGDECVDITRSSFSDREVRSLSTTLPPSNKNAKRNTYVAGSKEGVNAEDVEPEEYFDITTRLFQERGQSQSVFKEEDRSEMNSRGSSLYAKFQSKRSTPSRSPTRKDTRRSKFSGQSDNMEGAYMDITQRLWDERQPSSCSNPPGSAFKEEEKSEMNDRKRPTKKSVDKEERRSFSSLSQFINTGTKRSSDVSDDYVDASERFSDRSSFVQSVNSGTARRGTTSGSYKDSSRNVPAQVGDHVDESERFSDRSSFVQSVNSGTNRKGMTSGSYKDRVATAPVFDESGDYVDESERFTERSSFVQSVNSGTTKPGTTAGSFAESKKRPGSSASSIDDGYQDITQNPFARDRSSFVLRVNSGTRKMGTTTGSFRESKGKSEPEEKKYFSSDRSTLMGARTWRNEDAVTSNESDKYLSSDRSSILGPPSIGGFGRSSDEHTKYISSDRSSIVGAPSIRDAGGSREHSKYLTSDRSSLSGAPSIRRRSPSNEYLDTNQFSSNLSPSSPVKASATNKVWRTPSAKGGGESSIDTPPAFKRNLDMAGGRKTIKKRSSSDEFLNKNSFSQKLAPSTVTQAATVASRNNNPYLNKNGFNAVNSMRTSNASGAQFKRSHDVSPEEKEQLDNLDMKWAKLPDFDEMAGKSAVGENAKGSRSPKLPERDDEEYTMLGDFSRLERASSFVRDSNTATNSGLSGLADSGEVNEPAAAGGETLMSEEEDTDSEFEVMNWLLKHLPQLDEEDAVNYFVSLLEDGFDSADMLDEVLEEDLYFMKDEHQVLLMQNLAVEEDEVGETIEIDSSNSSEPNDSMSTELEDESEEEVEDERIDTELTAEEMDEAKEMDATNEGDDDYTDITRTNFGQQHVSLSSATPPLFDKESPSEGEPFSWQLDVRKEATEESNEFHPDSFSDQSAESNHLFQATPPVAVDLKEGGTVQESASSIEERRSVKPKQMDSNSGTLFQATPPLTVVLKEGMTGEEAAIAREERLSGGSPTVDQTPQTARISEGMTADQAEAARSTRLTASVAPSDEAPVESLKKEEKGENISPPRGALYQEYIARGFSTEQAQKLKHYYTTWTIGPSHEMKFSSVFTCPMSGEHFASGVLDNGEVWGGRVWYKNKKQSMNAAAAKTLDCFAFRKNDSDGSLQRCDDEPYFKDEEPALSSPPPNAVLPTELIRPNNT